MGSINARKVANDLTEALLSLDKDLLAIEAEVAKLKEPHWTPLRTALVDANIHRLDAREAAESLIREYASINEAFGQAINDQQAHMLEAHIDGLPKIDLRLYLGAEQLAVLEAHAAQKLRELTDDVFPDMPDMRAAGACCDPIVDRDATFCGRLEGHDGACGDAFILGRFSEGDPPGCLNDCATPLDCERATGSEAEDCYNYMLS